MAKDTLQKLADELEETMRKREDIEEQLEPIKEYEEQIREKLAKGLLQKGFKYIKTTSGIGFGIIDGRKTYIVKKGYEQEALEWAKKEYPSVLSISKTDLGKVLKPMLSLPEFFEEKVGEPYLAVRKAELPVIEA